MRNLAVLFVSALSLVLFMACAEELTGKAPGFEGAGSAQQCGDGLCHVGEVGACDSDCTVGAAVCGNGRCGDSETSATCPEDCANVDEVPDEPEPEPEVCDFPGGPGHVAFEDTHPALAWEGAFQGDDTTFDLDMNEFFCNDDYLPGIHSLAFVLGTGWCPACPGYIQHAAGLADQVMENGMMFVFVEAEDRDFVASTNYDANEFLKELIADAPSFRIGDADTLPTPGLLKQSPVVTAFPSGWVVRRSDMKVIASQSHSQYILPWVQISQNPDGNFDGAVSDVEANCGEEDEEVFEPNDDPQSAPAIEPSTFEGGVCAAAPDYYRVDLDGAWRFDLEFTHDVGDLDIYVWDLVANEVMKDNGRAVGSDSISDNESLEYEGPATLMIFGYDFATTKYSVTLTDLSN
jgi:hypothetical protein